MSKQPPPAPTASAVDPCPTIIQIIGRPGAGSLPSTIAPPDHPMIEWIQANPSIFNKAHADYENTKKRDQLFADKAGQLGEGLTGQDLYKWYLGQRTAFTKLIKRPASGSGTVLITARQQWMVESMSFLKGHCTSIPVRKGVDVSIFLNIYSFLNFILFINEECNCKNNVCNQPV